MRRQLGDIQGNGFSAAFFTILAGDTPLVNRTCANRMNGHASLQIGQIEVLYSIATVGGSQQRIECHVLVNG